MSKILKDERQNAVAMGGVIFKLDLVEALDRVGPVDLARYYVEDKAGPWTDEGRQDTPQGDPDRDVHKDLRQVVGAGQIEGLKPTLLRLFVVCRHYVASFIFAKFSQVLLSVMLYLRREIEEKNGGNVEPSESRHTYTYLILLH